MRKALILAAFVVAVVIAVIGILFATFDVNRHRDTIQSQLQRRFGRRVTLGEMRLNIFPLKFRVLNAAIADDPRFNTQRPFVQAEELDVSVGLLPLLRKSIEIDSLYLRRPSVELIKNREGVWNFASLGNTSQKTEQKRFSLSQLVIEDGQVASTDLHTSNVRSLYDHIDVSVRDFAPEQPFSIDVAAHLPGSETQQLKLQGTAGPITRGQPAATPFHGTLDLKQVAVGGLLKFVDSQAAGKTDGILTGKININSESGTLSANGQMNVQNARVNGRDLGYPIDAQYNITNDVRADVLTIHNATLKLGTTPLLISGTVDSKATPERIDLNVRGNNVSISELARLAADSGVAFTPGTTVTGRANVNIQARGPANKPAMSGTINGRDIEISGKHIPQALQVRAVDLVLTPDEIRSDNFNVISGGTTIATQFNVRQYVSKTPIIDATVRAPNAALPPILSLAKAYGITALDKVSGGGTLNLDLHAAGPVQSLTSAAITRALNGTLNVNFNNVHYSARDISHELAGIARFLGAYQTNRGFTEISRMTGNIVVRNGIAQTNNLQALLDIGNVGITGTANLVTEALNLRVTAVLSKEFSQRVGGTGIAGYMQTALANNQGELVVPAVVTGTIQHPMFSPDLQQVAQMKLKGLVPNFDNPAAAVSGLLGTLLKQNAGTQVQKQSQPQGQPQNPIQELIDIFGNKKKQQPPK